MVHRHVNDKVTWRRHKLGDQKTDLSSDGRPTIILKEIRYSCYLPISYDRLTFEQVSPVFELK